MKYYVFDILLALSIIPLPTILLAVLETKYLVLSKLTDTVLSFSHSLPIPSSVFTASSTFRYCSLRCK